MVYLFATTVEAHHFREACPNASIVICGVGAAECAAATAETISKMRSEGRDEVLLLAGIAGCYNEDDIALGDVVEVVQEEISALPSRFRKRYIAKAQTSLRSVSSNSVNSADECTSDAQIENMEGAAFFSVCQRLGAKSLQIRAISNVVGDPFSSWRLEEACENLSRVLKEVSVNLENAIG